VINSDPGQSSPPPAALEPSCRDHVWRQIQIKTHSIGPGVSFSALTSLAQFSSADNGRRLMTVCPSGPISWRIYPTSVCMVFHFRHTASFVRHRPQAGYSSPWTYSSSAYISSEEMAIFPSILSKLGEVVSLGLQALYLHGIRVKRANIPSAHRDALCSFFSKSSSFNITINGPICDHFPCRFCKVVSAWCMR